MSEPKNVFDVLKEQSVKIGHGEWVIKLIIYDGELVGFDQVEAPVVKFRQRKEK